jgi:hypothetical protein
MMVGACGTPKAAGQDLLFVTLSHCSGGESPSWVFFRRAKFNGTTWEMQPHRIVDIDSWHCPEHRMDITRLPNGRLWAAWSPMSRSGGVIARYSDDEGKTWRALPPGHLGTEGHGGTRPLLLPYKNGVACFLKKSWMDFLVWSHTDGETWSPIAHPVKKAKGAKFHLRAKAYDGAALSEDELFVMAGLRKTSYLLHLSGGEWKIEKGYPFRPLRLVDCKGKLTALGVRNKQLVLSVREAEGRWSEPRNIASVEDGGIESLVAPEKAPGDFIPLAWCNKTGKWIKFMSVQVNRIDRR